jgi:hypothetical protein
MKKNGHNFFWLSFSDLMTSLFFIMLVLYVLTYITLKKKESELQHTVADLQHKLAVYEIVEQNLKPLKEDTVLFRYEEQYKRFTLAFDVKFVLGQTQINQNDLENYSYTVDKIDKAGLKLKSIIDKLQIQKASDPKLKNVSYLVIISGYASHLLSGGQNDDYLRSYNRAYSLWQHWKSIGIDFEDKKYSGLIDLQISGNGWGGVGRFQVDPQNHFENETRNQRFIIQIVPKIGDTQ